MHSLSVILGLAAALACAVLIVRWGWREARKYSQAREAISRIARRESVRSYRKR